MCTLFDEIMRECNNHYDGIVHIELCVVTKLWESVKGRATCHGVTQI